MEKGDRFTRDFELSREIYEGFIALFADRNELHTDRAFAQAAGFKAEVMHGNILNGFLSYFVDECLPVRNVIIHSQEIKYSKPVYLGDRLTLSAEISEVFESVHALELRFRFVKADGEAVAKGKIQLGVLSPAS